MRLSSDLGRSKQRLPLGFGLALLGLGFSVVILQQATGGTKPTAAQIRSGTDGRAKVHALARLEPAGGLIVIGARPGIRIARVLVAEGDPDKAGQSLAILEGQEEARHQLALAEARKAQALHQRAQRRDEIAVERSRDDRLQQIHVAVLEDTTKALKAEDNRLTKDIQELSKVSPNSRQPDELSLKLDQVRIESYKAYFEREQARVDEALLDRKRSVEDKALADNGPDDRVLDRQIDLARAALDATTIKAPVAGEVIDVLARGGEVSSGPLLALGALSAIEAVAEVDQADVLTLNEGDEAEVAILGRTVPGKVTRIGRLVGRNQLMNADPRALQDQRVVKVTIRLGAAEPAARFISMQVDVAITPASASPR